MSVLLDLGRLAAVLNVGLLLVLIYVWGTGYRRHRASHTLGLLIFAAVFLLQNLLWIYLYGFHRQFVGWFVEGDTIYQFGVTMLCGLQTVALAVLAKITWK